MSSSEIALPCASKGAAADQAALDLEARDAFGIEPVDELLDLDRDFGADAVAGQ